MKDLTYDNGYPYTDPLPVWLDTASSLVQEQNKACLILVDGELGQGKSTMAAQMLRQIDPGFVATEESFKLRYQLGGTALLGNVVKAHSKGAKGVIFDEAGIDLSSRSAMSTMNKNLLAFFQIHRALKVVVFLVMPSISIVDRQIFKYGIHRFHVHTHSMVYGKYTQFRLWDRKATLFLRLKLEERVDPRDAYFAKTGFSNFNGWSKPLPKEYQDMLDKFGLEAKKERLMGLGGADGISVYDAATRLRTSVHKIRNILPKHGIRTWPDPTNNSAKMFSMEDFERLKTLEFGGEEAL
jgi:hypothetical protein